jgi:hypothetical protein
MLPNSKLNRNLSFGANVVQLNNGSGGGGSYSPGYHSLNNGSEASPLKLFSRAKQAINTIYQEFYSFIGEINQFLDCKFSSSHFRAANFS